VVPHDACLSTATRIRLSVPQPRVLHEGWTHMVVVRVVVALVLEAIVVSVVLGEVIHLVSMW
jgi:hypothetical protein